MKFEVEPPLPPGCPDVQSLTRGYILALYNYIYIIHNYIIMCVCLIVIDDIYLYTHIYIYVCGDMYENTRQQTLGIFARLFFATCVCPFVFSILR